MKIYLGADHRGYKLKENIFQWLVDAGYEVEDFGAYELVKDDDYTVFAEKVASVVGEYYSSGHSEHTDSMRGILFCGSGVGVDVVANKFDGVRASVGKSADQVKAGRKDDDMNILVIAADFTKKSEAVSMVKAFLDAKFDDAKRHERRLEDIKRIEENN